MKTDNKPPSPEEWDFDADSPELKGRNLLHCYRYEFARCVPSVLRFAEQNNNLEDSVPIVLRKKCDVTSERTSTFVSNLKHNDVVLSISKEFPHTPFLQTVFGKHGKHAPGAPIWTSEPPAVEFFDEGGRWLDCSSIPEFRSENVFSIYIRWDKSDATIVQDFRRILKIRRPFQTRSNRGANRMRSIATDLRALGAWRLLHFARGNIKEARRIVAEVRSGMAYTRDEDWLKAEKRAQKIIDDWSNREVFRLRSVD